MDEREIAQILELDNPLSHFVIKCNSHARQAYNQQTGEDGISLPDPIAMCLALDPTVGTEWSTHLVEVETQSKLTRGMTVVDRLNVSADERNHDIWAEALKTQPKTKVYWSIDTNRWKEALFNSLR